MIAVSVDPGGKEVVQDYFRKAGVTLPVLLDSDQRVGKRYGITGVPETFIIDKKGVIVKKIIGPLDWSHPDVVSFFNEMIKKEK